MYIYIYISIYIYIYIYIYVCICAIVCVDITYKIDPEGDNLKVTPRRASRSR